jgi:hypothetical protein
MPDEADRQADAIHDGSYDEDGWGDLEDDVDDYGYDPDLDWDDEDDYPDDDMPDDGWTK